MNYKFYLKGNGIPYKFLFNGDVCKIAGMTSIVA